MDAQQFLTDNEPEFDDDVTERLDTVTLTRLPNVCITVSMVSPGLTVHNVMRGSYVHRLMLSQGYKEQVKS